tara:strand:- start:15 stop:728 length:714 start_codon:yes stop_codon:yes gene_type:complete
MARVKKKSHEKLTSQNIQHVISLLNPTSSQTKAITKREACSILNISYNTTRLDKIIEDYHEQKEYRSRRVSQNRGRPARPDEVQDIVKEYLSGENVSNIAKGLYRSPAFVKSLLEKIGVPQRPTKVEGRKQEYYLPEQCVADNFDEGEIVWSATHHAPAVIDKKLSKEHQDSKAGLQTVDYVSKYGSDCYSIYVRQKPSTEDMWDMPEVGGFYAFALAYDLGKLKHLEEYGVDLQKL